MRVVAPDLAVSASKAFLRSIDHIALERPSTRQALVAMYLEALRSGPQRAGHDAALMVRPWGFDLGEIRVAVYLWHGEHDWQVPPIMGRYLAEAIEGCCAQFYPAEGHLLLIVNQAGPMLSQLARGVAQ